MKVLLLISLILSGCSIKDNSNPNLSPFAQDKVILSNSLVRSSQSGGGNLPIGTKLGFIVTDSCVQARIDRSDPIPFFVDKYFAQVKDSSNTTGSDELITESIIPIDVISTMTIKDLEYLTVLDKCIIGIADLQAHDMNSATFNDPNYNQQRSSYLDLIGFEQADTFFSNSITSNIKVKVAVIDSGYDITNGDVASLQTENLDLAEGGLTPQDTLGHGTEVANIIAASKNSKGVVGIAHRNTTLIPVRAFKNASIQVHDGFIYDSIKRAVNDGAEVINMSFSAILDREAIIHDDTLSGDEWLEEREKDKALVCSPIIGHAIFRSIERGVFLSIAAGHGTSYEKYFSGEFRGRWKKYKKIAGSLVECASPDDSGCDFKKEKPGTLKVPRDNGGAFFGNNSMPACWSRYYQGAMSVAALDMDGESLAEFSNWGSDGFLKNDGVEIAAPGVGITLSSLNNQTITSQGTSFAAPQVAAAATLIKAFYKNQQNLVEQNGGDSSEWHINPWIIEGIISESAVKSDILDRSTKPVRNGRILNLSSIAQYLSDLSGLDYAQRRVIASINDNGDIADGHGANQISGGTRVSDTQGVTVLSIDTYARKRTLNNKDQLQMQVVAYFSDGSTEVVTDKATLTISTGHATITAAGVLLPDITKTGSIKVTGQYAGKSNDFTIYATDKSIISGGDSLVPRSIRIVGEQNRGCCFAVSGLPEGLGFGTNVRLRVYAEYEGGIQREVTAFASKFLKISETQSKKVLHFVDTSQSSGGETLNLTAYYLGVKGTANIILKKATMSKEDITLTLYNQSKGGKSTIPLTQLGFDDSIDMTVKLGEQVNLFAELDSSYNSKNPHITSPQGFIATGLTKDGVIEPLNGFKTEDLAIGLHKFKYHINHRGNGVLEKFEGNLSIKVEADLMESFQLYSAFNYSNPESSIGFQNPHIFDASSFYLSMVHESESGIFHSASESSQIEIKIGNVIQTPVSTGAWSGTYTHNSRTHVYTHKANTLHQLNVFDPVLSQTISVPFKYKGSTRSVTGASQFYHDPVSTFNQDNSDKNWTIVPSAKANRNQNFQITNNKTPSSFCATKVDQTQISGTGIKTNPFKICSEAELIKVFKDIDDLRSDSYSDFTALYGSDSKSPRVFIELESDINLSKPGISILNLASPRYIFRNKEIALDGNGHKFQFLIHTDSEQVFTGLFGNTCPKLSNVGFEQMSIRAASVILLCKIANEDLNNLYFKDISIESLYESGVRDSGSAHFIEKMNGMAKNIFIKTSFSGSGEVAPFSKVFNINGIVADIEILSNPGANRLKFAGVSHQLEGPSGNTSGSRVLDPLRNEECTINSTAGISEICMLKTYNIVNARLNLDIKTLGSSSTNQEVAGTLNDLGNGMLANLEVTGKIESVQDNVGGLVNTANATAYGVAGGYIIDSSFDGFVYGRDNVGGIASRLFPSHLQNLDVSGIVSGVTSVGGIAGKSVNFATVVDSNVSGVTVSASHGSGHKGAIVGYKHMMDTQYGTEWIQDIMRNNTFTGNIYGNQSDIPPASMPITNIAE